METLLVVLLVLMVLMVYPELATRTSVCSDRLETFYLNTRVLPFTASPSTRGNSARTGTRIKLPKRRPELSVPFNNAVQIGSCL